MNLSWMGRIGAFFQWGAKSVGSSLGAILAAVILFTPDMAVLGGFVADAANAEFRYSVTSLLGLLAAFLNALTTLFSGRGGQTTEYSLGGDIGSAPGVLAAATATAASVARAPTRALNSVIGVGSAARAAPPAPPAQPAPAWNDDAETLSLHPGSVPSTISMLGGARITGNPSSILGIPLSGSKAQPAGLAVLVAIVTIYTIDAMSGKRFGAALGLQVAIGICTVLAYCASYYYTEGFGPSWYFSFIPVVLGISVGMLYFALPAQYHPLDPEQSPTPTGEFSKCAAGNGSGEFVCDAYLNGQRIGTVPT